MTPRRLGEYVIERELAAGGMGCVYRARHPRLDRPVALKTMLYDGASDPEQVERFQREARALAELSHPNIVRIHAAALEGLVPYLVMDLVEGQSLHERIQREGPLDPREAAELILLAAQAIHHAHEHSILHRDLKPSNVLITTAGVPRVTDFGLAKDLSDSKGRLTRTGQVLGTPNFMPPEQVEGDRTKIAAPADVYGLGATLYAALSGHPPFRGKHVVNVLNAVLTQEPPGIRAERPEVSAELEAIALKCLRKDPAERYPSAAALADDLARWIRGSSVHAKARGRVARLRRWSQKHRRVRGLMALLILLGVTVPVAWWYLGRAREPAVSLTEWIALGERALAQNAHREARSRFARALALDPESLPALLGAGDAARANDLWSEAIDHYTRALASDPTSRRALWGRARAHAAHEAPEAALRDLRQAHAGGADGRELRRLYGRLSWRRASDRLARATELAGALADLHTVIEVTPEREVKVLALARRARLRGRLHGEQRPALADCAAALALDPRSHEAHLARGVVRRRFHTGLDLPPLEDFDRALKLKRTADAYAERALALLTNAVGSQRALADRDQALAIEPRHALAHVVLARVLAWQGRWEELREPVDTALEIDPNCVPALILRARLGAWRRPGGDVKAFARAYELDPWDTETCYRWGQHLALRDPDEARRLLQRALKLAPRHPYALHRLGMLQQRRKEYRRSIASFTRAVDASRSIAVPMYPSHLAKAKSHFALREYEQATESLNLGINALGTRNFGFGTAQGDRTSLREAYTLRCRLHYRAGRLTAALRDAESCLKISDPKRGDTAIGVGRVLRSIMKYNKRTPEAVWALKLWRKHAKLLQRKPRR